MNSTILFILHFEHKNSVNILEIIYETHVNIKIKIVYEKIYYF